VTWANAHYSDFVLNWVAHVREAGINGYLVGAMDDQLLQAGGEEWGRMEQVEGLDHRHPLAGVHCHKGMCEWAQS
jgi:hypothetical protein